MDETGRISWLDVTRIVSIFGVVLLHVAAPYLYQFGQIATEDWHTANIIDAFTRPSVPLFFMVSGALLLGRPVGISQLKSRLLRLIVPLAVWSVIYLAIQVYLNPSIDLTRPLFSAVIAPVMYHLWFLYALIGLYLCLPLAGPVIQAASPTQLWYGLGLWVLASGIIPALERTIGVNSPIELSTVAGYMGYMVLGYVLASAPKPTRAQVIIAVALIIAGYGITVLATAFITVQQGWFFEWFYGYLTPNVMLFSAGAFVVLRAMFEGRQSVFVRRLSDLSFGIYLSHIAIIGVATRMFDIHDWWIIPFAVVVFTASAILVFVLRRFGLAKILAP